MATVNRGTWIGTFRQLLAVLRNACADTDDEGLIMLWGDTPVAHMGRADLDGECLITDRCLCRVGGMYVPVTDLLNGSGCGFGGFAVIQ